MVEQLWCIEIESGLFGFDPDLVEGSGEYAKDSEKEARRVDVYSRDGGESDSAADEE